MAPVTCTVHHPFAPSFPATSLIATFSPVSRPCAIPVRISIGLVSVASATLNHCGSGRSSVVALLVNVEFASLLNWMSSTASDRSTGAPASVPAASPTATRAPPTQTAARSARAPIAFRPEKWTPDSFPTKRDGANQVPLCLPANSYPQHGGNCHFRLSIVG